MARLLDTVGIIGTHCPFIFYLHDSVYSDIWDWTLSGKISGDKLIWIHKVRLGYWDEQGKYHKSAVEVSIVEDEFAMEFKLAWSEYIISEKINKL